MCSVCLQTVKIINTYLNYLFRIWWYPIKCVVSGGTPYSPQPDLASDFGGSAPTPILRWELHMIHPLAQSHPGKERDKTTSNMTCFPLFVCTSGNFSFDFRLQTIVPGRDCMHTKGLHPSFSAHCPHGSVWMPPSDTMLFHLMECSCLCDVNNFNYLWIKNPFFRPISQTSAKFSNFY